MKTKKSAEEVCEACDVADKTVIDHDGLYLCRDCAGNRESIHEARVKRTRAEGR